MNKIIKKRKSESQLIRFVWSRRQEYDYALLHEVQARNPFSSKNQKPIWEDIAKRLQQGELKMKVSERSCRERMNELLKKHRKEEALIIRSTGATDDETSEIKFFLEIVDEMARTKPAEKEAVIYSKKKKVDGETVRDGVLKNLTYSDSESDDYINDKYTRNDSGKKSRPNEEIEIVTGANDFFTDKPMSLEEEALMDEASINELIHEDIQPESWHEVPTSSRDNRHSIPLTDVSLEASHSAEVILPLATSPSLDVVASDARPTQALTAPIVQQSTSESIILQSTTAVIHRQSTAVGNSASNRFSNPKKDLITFFEKKAEIEMEIHKEENRLRGKELANKTEELKILRLKTEAEVDEKRKAMEFEAENKREKLRLLQLKTMAEIEERKANQELFISLLAKKN